MGLCQVIAIGSAIALVGTGYAQSPTDMAMFARGKDAIIALPPNIACNPVVMDYAWSRDGSTIIATRMEYRINPKELGSMMSSHGATPPELRFEIVIWTASTQTSRVVYSTKSHSVHGQDISFMGRSGAALVTVTDNESDTTLVLLASPASGSARVVAQAKGNQLAGVGSPTQPTGAIINENRVAIINTSGAVVRDAEVPAGMDILGWDPTGTIVALRTVMREVTPVSAGVTPPAVSSTPARVAFYAFGPNGLAPSDERRFEFFRDESPEDDWTIISPASVSDPGGTVKTQSVRIGTGTGPEESALLSVDGTRGSVNPGRTYASYVSQGALFVRPLAVVDKKVMDEARDAAERTKLISDAKQVALAFLMFAGDNDDVLPTGKGWEDTIMPYLRSQDILSGFIYKFGGGDLTKLESPAETILGYKPGRGGRAVAYVDGHVKWIPDPQP